MGTTRVGVAAGIICIQATDDAVTVLRIDLAQELIDLRLDPFVTLLGLRRADIEEKSEPSNLPQELQEFGLPVLQGITHGQDEEFRCHDRLAMSLLLVEIGEPAEDPVTCQGDQKNPSVTQAKP
jgi:hypothetical protein